MAYTLGITQSAPIEAAAPVAREHGSSALLDHLARLMRAQAESALAPLGLRPRHLVALTILRDNNGGTQQALASLLSMDRTNLVGLLNDLEADDLIARRRDAVDRRRHLVELTEVGASRLAEAEAALSDAEETVLGALDADQRRQLRELLQLAAAGHAGDCNAAINHSASACAAAAAADDGC